MRGSRSHAPHPLPAGRKVKRPAHHGSVRTDTKPESRPSTPTERDLVDLVKQLAIREQAITPTSNPAVIKIYATLQEPDYKNPWQMVRASLTLRASLMSAIGPGRAGNRIWRGSAAQRHQEDSHSRACGAPSLLRFLLEADRHKIADYTYIQVQKTDIDDPELQTASVYAVTHEVLTTCLETLHKTFSPPSFPRAVSLSLADFAKCDLALLELDKADEAFLDGIEPAELGDLPNLRDKVYVAGFPIGGEELSITEGVRGSFCFESCTHPRCPVRWCRASRASPMHTRCVCYLL